MAADESRPVAGGAAGQSGPDGSAIGLIGGMSWESTARYYALLNQERERRHGAHHNGASVVVTLDFAQILVDADRGRMDLVAQRIAAAAERLHLAGCAFGLLTAVTAHAVYDDIVRSTHLSLLHVADATVEELRAAGVARAGLLGTRRTLESRFYRERLEAAGIGVVLPEAGDVALLDRVIREELTQGRVLSLSREQVLAVAERLAANGAGAIVLACTELGLLVQSGAASVPIVDTVPAHVRAALDRPPVSIAPAV